MRQLTWIVFTSRAATEPAQGVVGYAFIEEQSRRAREWFRVARACCEVQRVVHTEAVTRGQVSRLWLGFI